MAMGKLATTAVVTRPPRIPVVLFDGDCGFCTAQARRLAAPGKISLRSFREEAALAAFPGLSLEECVREMKLVDRDGRIYGGAEAIARTLGLGRRFLGKFALLYYVPGVRWIADRLYAWVARNRFRLPRSHAAACDDGTCGLHTTSSEG
jgi:predicted DCC family thiol-disulfide oxidoreductase YuxK